MRCHIGQCLVVRLLEIQQNSGTVHGFRSLFQLISNPFGIMSANWNPVIENQKRPRGQGRGQIGKSCAIGRKMAGHPAYIRWKFLHSCKFCGGHGKIALYSHGQIILSVV